MTKKLSKEEKNKRREERHAKGQRMQKAPSKTVQKVQVPKTEDPEVNLCDNCAYEFGECPGTPFFVEEEGSDRVVKCSAWIDVDKFPTIQEQDNKAADDYDEEEPPELPEITEEEIQADVEASEERSINEKEMAIPGGLPARPDPKRFQNDDTDYGTCPACGRQLKRTAYNRYRDAIRCTNPRCGQYREIIKTISTGVK